MKNLFHTLLVAGVAFGMLTLNACTNDMLEEPAEIKQEGNPKEVMFIANNFVADGSSESRTLIEDGKFAWAEGDTIGILPDEGSQVYFKINNIEEGEANKAKFTGGAWGLKAGNDYAAYYPFIQDIMLERTAIPVDYSKQTYSAREDGKVSPSHDYMAAMPVEREDGGLNFQFKHLGALVEVQFTLPEGKSGAVKQLTLMADEPVFPLCGTFDLTADAVAIAPAEGKESSCLRVNVENLTAEAGKPVSVFFMLPPMAEANTLSWKAAVMYGENNALLPLVVSTEKTELKAGYYYTLETDEMTDLPAAIEIPDGWTFNQQINNLLGTLGGTKLRFVTCSPMVSETEAFADDNDVKAYAVRNGDWLEVHTLAKSFKLPEYSAELFSGCSSLTSLDLSGFDTSSVTNMGYMFSGCSSLTSLDLSGFVTSSVTDMNGMFKSCLSLKSLDLSSFDTSSVTYMNQMFEGCSSLNSITFGEDFDTSSVTTMGFMFLFCESLNSLDLSGFDTSSVTDMNCMFTGCSSLTSLDLSGFETSSVMHMNGLFSDCSSLKSLDLSSFDTSSVTHMNQMFSGCSSLTSLDLSSFDTSSVTDMTQMFAYCSSLTSLDLSGFDTSSVTDMNSMFSECSSLTSLDLSSFDTSSVTNMTQMFSDCSSLTSLDLSVFDTSSVTNMSCMFFNCNALETLDLSVFDTSSVTDMSYMFLNCEDLESLDISSFTFKAGGECDYYSMFGSLGYNFGNSVVYVKSQDEIDLLNSHDHSLTYGTLQVKP